MTEPPARRIGRYEIAALLGRGGMAEVYRARDPQLGREVAVKLILPALAGEEDFGRRFASEARAVAKLAHPNIVQIYDIGSAEAGPYLVMEFVPGGTLKERLKAAGGPLPYDEVARIARAIGLALDEAHARGVIHRDVKPANILFRADGAPVLTDFGIARIANTTQITASSALTGTPAYMAPEQVTGHPVPQSDLYSLGVALFEMLTGRLPFTAETATEMAVKHLQAEPPSPLTIRPSLPPAIDGVLRMALAKDAARRYPTGETLAAAVEAALGVAAGRCGCAGRAGRAALRAERAAWPAGADRVRRRAGQSCDGGRPDRAVIRRDPQQRADPGLALDRADRGGRANGRHRHRPPPGLGIAPSPGRGAGRGQPARRAGDRLGRLATGGPGPPAARSGRRRRRVQAVPGLPL
jgi:serine/threonine-protein kinase